MDYQNKVFLGGTCANTTWREVIIPRLNIPYFNPVVEDWTPIHQAIEETQKGLCGIHLYVLTSAMEGVFSVAEVVNSSHDKTKVTVLQVRPDGFTEGQLKSLKAVVAMVEKNGAVTTINDDLNQSVHILNNIGLFL